MLRTLLHRVARDVGSRISQTWDRPPGAARQRTSVHSVDSASQVVRVELRRTGTQQTDKCRHRQTVYVFTVTLAPTQNSDELLQVHSHRRGERGIKFKVKQRKALR